MKRKWKIIVITATILLLLGVSACGTQELEGDNSAENSTDFSEKAASVGDSVQTKKRAESDEKLYEVTWKATKVILDAKQAEDLVKQYNLSAQGSTVGALDGDAVQYGVMQYQVHYPEEFPAEEYGIRDPALEFRITANDGTDAIPVTGEDGGITVYHGLGDTWEIGKRPQGYDFYLGQTYQGAIVFIIPKEQAGFLIAERYDSADGEVVHYLRPEEK